LLHSMQQNKLHISTDCFSVSDLTNWNHVPNSKKAGNVKTEETPLIIIKGQTVYGQKLYVNSSQFIAEVKHNRLFIQLNPSKINHPYNLVSDADLLHSTLINIENEIKNRLQTDLDILNTSVSRIDISAQAQMNKTVPFYHTIIQGSKNYKRAPKTEYPDGFLISNRSRQICIYDKGLKLEIDNSIKNPNSSNFLRLETRIINKKAVKSHTPFNVVMDVINNTNELHKSYSKTVGSLLKLEQKTLNLEVESVSSLILTAKKIDKRGWLGILFALLSTGNLISKKQFEAALIHLNDSDRSTIHRNVIKYGEYLHQIKLVRSSINKENESNYADNYSEFMDKLINPYKQAI